MSAWIGLAEAVRLVGARLKNEDRAKDEILQALRRCEMKATAEQCTDHWIHRRTQLKERGLYVVVAHQTEYMSSLHQNWWNLCEVDWNAGTAHGRWCESDRAKVSQPYRILVTGVILPRADLDRLWPPVVEQATKSPPHRPIGSGLANADAPLLERIHELRLENASSPTAAAKLVVGDGLNIPGGGNVESKIDRLVRRYKAKYMH